ncbi:MAG: lipid-A-disaccharide synthase-related protein [Leptolyngbyaceae cyanobacterium bins.59]|nr:lipid-A-disaccharide synthase-related protein [Leptolyngbyaceae cyanobacterium bins.59]
MRVLFISNGHGEDLNGSLVLSALQQVSPALELLALPVVGAGNAYRRSGARLISPTQAMPSGGMFYMNPLELVRDIFSGLVRLTWQQIRAVRTEGRDCDLIVAVGDQVPLLFAYATGRPYVSFIVSTSSYYEGRLKLPLVTERLLRSSRCLQVFTRDAFTAEDLQQRGFTKALFAGYPIMDNLQTTQRDLQLIPDVPMVALLPGSRLPEACHNFALQLQLCQTIARIAPWPIQFRAALVPSFTDETLQSIAQEQGWQCQGGQFCKSDEEQTTFVQCYTDAFPDILHQCDLAIGMAGTAVEQAVGLGKPVIQICGSGPQFTYRFAEAQMRLLGPSVQTIGTRSATPAILAETAQVVVRTLKDHEYRTQCVAIGRERVGDAGGSEAIARCIQTWLEKMSSQFPKP